MTDSPPGGGTFSLEGRPASGLYLVAWLLSGAGIALFLLAGMTSPPVLGLMRMAGLLALAAGLAAAAGYQVLARRDRPASAYRGPSPLIVFGIYFTVVIAVGVALIALGLDIESPVGVVVALAVQVIGYFVAVWLFAVRTGALRPVDLDLGRSRAVRRWLPDALFGAGVMLPATFVILIVTFVVFTLLGVEPPDVVPTVRQPLEIFLIALAVVVLVPIGEELFFRGFALTAWLRDLGERAAVVRSAAFFAVVHLITLQTTVFDEGLRQALGVMLIILPVGVILGLLFTRRGLAAAMAAHVTYNGIGYFGRLLADNLGPPPA